MISLGVGGGEYSDILVIYVGSDHFLGFKTLNFNTFWGFHKKKNIFGGGGGGGYEGVNAEDAGSKPRREEKL